ncbi:MAG TPA: Shedu immune nuclease family protein [Terriglobales bacterium]|nr:Shedu immune nuclease family protein [Terriglobales bacterium]
MKQTPVFIQPGQPLQFPDGVAQASDKMAENPQMKYISNVGKTLSAYLKAARKLLEEKYASLKDLAPPHMRDVCDIFVLRCNDGIFVRYDLSQQQESKLRCGDSVAGLAEIAPQFSEQVIHFPDNPDSYVPAEGPTITLSKTCVKDGSTQEIAKTRPLVYAKTSFPESFKVPEPPARPPTLALIHNDFEIQLPGVIGPEDGPVQLDGPDTQQFIARRHFKLKVGWEAIEIYPMLSDDYWNPSYAPLWAEIDLLATVAQKNQQNSVLATLDSRAMTRKYYATLLQEFETLLQGKEEPVHQFLKQHPELLCPTCEKSWSKLPFGKGDGKRVSDFVFRESHNDYLLVEIEAPIRELFRKDGQQREELTHAINQIADWIQYIADNKHKVEEELGLAGISTNPRILVVIGRSSSLTEENRRKLVTLQATQNKLRILTYDDLIAIARATLGRLFGPLDQPPTEEVYYY